MVRIPVFAAFLLGIASSHAAIVENIADLTKLNLEFDFIVVGGGTAGNVIANRLSENPNYSVLVLEAGGSNSDVLNLAVPFYGLRAVPNTPQDWNYTTTPQVNLNGRSLTYILEVLYDMVYTRGSKEDFDRFARVTGDDGWSWDSMIPYMRKNEHFSPPVDHHNTTGQFNPAVHGFDGITTVSLAGFPTPIDGRVIETTSQLGEFPYNEDMNSGYHLGIGWVQATINNGSRSSSATSYLAPHFIASRPNLNILLHASGKNHIASLVAPGSNGGGAQGMGGKEEGRPTNGMFGKRFTLTAKKEIILSAGTIGTPNIYCPRHHLPSVGQNLSEHALVGLTWRVNSTDTWETANRNATLVEEELDRWNTTRTGPLVDTTTSHLGWLRISDSSSIFERFPDPAAGPNTAQFELVVSNGFHRPDPTNGQFPRHHCRGAVTLNSSDPLEAPLIDPNFLDSELDFFLLRESVRSAMRFAAAPVWGDYILSPVNFNGNITDPDLDKYIRNNAGPVYHPVGTASMSPQGASYGVVDPDLRVKGLAGLRVVDASIAPFIPAAHTQAVAYFIG
ncbi:aryl-alcohol-oxidase from pleurotus Eryingii [Mycena latifolia]|nr:aryl-alcohol-oxidase from pleurotus Eryingii [Mycena latifolia]